MPWLNGRGESLEIAGDRGLDDAWSWRLAMAPVVADGQFSKIDGVDRQLVLVEGDGMTLTIDRKVFECNPLEIISFRGEAMTSARLARGPIRDINLMTRRGSCNGSLVVVRSSTKIDKFEYGVAGSTFDSVVARVIVAVEPTECAFGSKNLDLAFGDAILLAQSDEVIVVAGAAVVATIIDVRGQRRFAIRALIPRSARQSRSRRQSRD